MRDTLIDIATASGSAPADRILKHIESLSAEQQALVEAVPIPMVVTAIPGHVVLHANPPAEKWLNGLRTDPWAVGLDPDVRARPCQNMADHD